jgi:hypothetical protein
MGPLQLPFQGLISSPIQLLKITDTGNNQETDLLVAIVFARTKGTGTVTLQVTSASGAAVTFSANLSNNESGKSIVVPVKYMPETSPTSSPTERNGVWLLSADQDARGNILIATIS